MSIRKTLLGMAAGSVLIAGLSLVAGPAANASQTTIRQQTNMGGVGIAGYYGADDNWTHYRFTQMTTQATPQLVNLNGTLVPGAVGTTLCDPNINYAAQVGLLWDPNGTGTPTVGSYRVFWAIGQFAPNTFADSCSQAGFVKTLVKTGPGGSLKCPTFWDCGSFNLAISQNDLVQLSIYYTPTHNGHFHQVSFGAADVSSGVARQAYSFGKYNLNFWEAGDGAVNGNTAVLTAPDINPLAPVTGAVVTCYSCSHQTPLFDVQSVTGLGGLTQVTQVNTSSQPIFGASVPSAYPSSQENFNLLNGSTSI